MIWTHSFFCLSPHGYGVVAFFFFYSLSPAALDLPLCHEPCSFFPKQLNLRFLFCSGERVKASRAGLCSFLEVATTHLPQASTMEEAFSGLLFCTQSLLSNEVWEKESFNGFLLCVLFPEVLNSHTSPYLGIC